MQVIARRGRHAQPHKEVNQGNGQMGNKKPDLAELKRQRENERERLRERTGGFSPRSRWFMWIPMLVLVSILIGMYFWGSNVKDIDTSQGLELLKGQSVQQVAVEQGTNYVTLTLSKPYVPKVAGKEVNKGKVVRFQFLDRQAEAVMAAVEKSQPSKGFNVSVPQQGMLSSLLMLTLPMVLLFALFWFVLMRSQGGSKMFGKSNVRMVNKEKPTVTFKDVAGVDEAIEELEEIKDFLQDGAKYVRLGARIPKGVLLYGPPGTGKTLLAKAVAGEASVPFFHISGSEFVEMFVGVGASRVRSLFEQAKRAAPAIVFIDEIDSIGSPRGSGVGGGAEEREQTLNQLLVEMDGFESSTNIILIAATNRPDILDQALLRPGRFDRQVAVDVPDLKGRQAILEVHSKGKPLAPDVDMELIARRTPGFAGADLANVLNEAALLTARAGADLIDMRAIDEAVDRVMAGPQRRTRIMSEKEKLMTAYHEGGHALTAAALHHTDPVTKVTILPRGKALGYTMVMPTEDRYSVSRNQLLDQLVYALGGRVAEEVVFHDPTSGASNDIEKLTATARAMVTKYGMSARLGAVERKDGGTGPGPMLFGGTNRNYSEQTALVIDEEVQALVDKAHDEAWEIITRNRPVLDRLVTALMEKETLLEAEIKEIFADIIKQPEREQWLSSPHRPVQNLPLATYNNSVSRPAMPQPPQF